MKHSLNWKWPDLSYYNKAVFMEKQLNGMYMVFESLDQRYHLVDEMESSRQQAFKTLGLMNPDYTDRLKPYRHVIPYDVNTMTPDVVSQAFPLAPSVNMPKALLFRDKSTFHLPISWTLSLRPESQNLLKERLLIWQENYPNPIDINDTVNEITDAFTQGEVSDKTLMAWESVFRCIQLPDNNRSFIKQLYSQGIVFRETDDNKNTLILLSARIKQSVLEDFGPGTAIVYQASPLSPEVAQQGLYNPYPEVHNYLSSIPDKVYCRNMEDALRYVDPNQGIAGVIALDASHFIPNQYDAMEEGQAFYHDIALTPPQTTSPEALAHFMTQLKNIPVRRTLSSGAMNARTRKATPPNGLLMPPKAFNPTVHVTNTTTHRKNDHITVQYLMDTFGFRETQFDKTLTQSALNVSFDTLYDLANIMEIEPIQLGRISRFQSLMANSENEGNMAYRMFHEMDLKLGDLISPKKNIRLSQICDTYLTHSRFLHRTPVTIKTGIDRFTLKYDAMTTNNIHRHLLSINKSHDSPALLAQITPIYRAMNTALIHMRLGDNLNGGDYSISRFYRDAQHLDGIAVLRHRTRHPKATYWSTSHEMLARAFSCYCHDTLAEKGQENTYLTAGSKPLFFRVGFQGNPNPEGEERVLLNHQLDHLLNECASLIHSMTHDDELREQSSLHSQEGDFLHPLA